MCSAWRATRGCGGKLHPLCTKLSTRASGSRSRRVVAKAEYLEKGENPHYLVTSLGKKEWRARALYEQLYGAHGEMENRIKEQRNLFSDRLSTETLRANQLRLYFSSLAHVPLQVLRRLGWRARMGYGPGGHPPAALAKNRRSRAYHRAAHLGALLKRVSLKASVCCGVVRPALLNRTCHFLFCHGLSGPGSLWPQSPQASP